jgi:hypothetical protein
MTPGPACHAFNLTLGNGDFVKFKSPCLEQGYWTNQPRGDSRRRMECSNCALMGRLDTLAAKANSDCITV